MPTSAPRPCSMPGCGAFGVYGGRCAEHTAQATGRKGSAARRGYDWSWQRVRARYLRRTPLCEEPGCDALADEVDHIIPIRADPSRRLDPTNLRALCAPHHRARTARDQPGGWAAGPG